MRAILIKECFGCPHWDHSGAFTPGGAKPLCRKKDGRTLPRDRFRIPGWCPLPRIQDGKLQPEQEG